MKIIVLIALVIGAMFVGGWITFGDSDSSATASFNKEEAKKDTAAVVAKGKELIEDGKELLHDANQSEQTSMPEEKKAVE